MQVSNMMFVVKCPKCTNPIRGAEGKFVGGVQDDGGAIIQCEKCSKVFPIKLKNPDDASGIEKGGKVLDTWTDEFPDYLKEKYHVDESDILSIEKAIVFGYEKPPKIEWHPYPSIYVLDGVSHEESAFNALKANRNKVEQNYQKYYHHYIKNGSEDCSFVVLHYELGGNKHKAIFAKQIESEKDFNSENLYLIMHSAIDLQNEIDGIYSKSEAIVYLERLLNRWRYTANEILLVVPFIGYPYKTAAEARLQLWDWLQMNLDVEKTNLVTRKGTHKLMKEAYKNSEIPYDVLKEWGLVESLAEAMDNGDMTFFERSHAKYYVGVYDDKVEVMHGSFNIHTGPSLENISFRNYEKDFFQKRYLDKMKQKGTAGFSYSSKPKDKAVHYMVIGDSEPKNYVIGLQEFIQTYFLLPR